MATKRVDYNREYDKVLETFAKIGINGETGAIPTGVIAGVEFIDSDGEYWIVLIKEDNMPRWKAIGMLYHLIDEVNADET